MKKLLLYTTTAIFCSISLYGDYDLELSKSKAEKTFLEEFKLPDDHPVKAELDRIFSDKHVLQSTSTLKKAGFISPKERNRGMILGRHENLKGYLLKLYVETRKINEFQQWQRRIKGACLIQKALDKFDYNHLMKVPNKWIYPVPGASKKSTAASPYPKHYVLVVEDMDIFNDRENVELYRSVITKEHLVALYNILTTCLLSDSTWLPNIPFSHDGRIAHIDTEFAGETLSIWARLPRLSKYLSDEMRHVWEVLIGARRKELQAVMPRQQLEYEAESDEPSYEDDIASMDELAG